MLRLGLFGGSFNPVHNAHVRMALEAREALSLDRVEFLLAARPPHKEAAGILPFATRWHLLNLAVAGIDGLSISTVEALRARPSYTIETLQFFAEARPDAEVSFILGAEDLLAMPTWHRGKELCNLANFIAVRRADTGLEDVEFFIPRFWPDAERESGTSWRFASGRTLTFVEAPWLEISSTGVRERFLAGRSLTGLVPCRVEAALRGPLAAFIRSVWEA